MSRWLADDLTAERLVMSLRAIGYCVTGAVEQDATDRLAMVSLVRPTGDNSQTVIVDVLFASSGIEPEIA